MSIAGYEKDTKVVILPPSVVDFIENMRVLSGRQSLEEVFNDSIALYDWAIRRRDDGYKIGAYKESEELFYQLDLPTLILKDE